MISTEKALTINKPVAVAAPITILVPTSNSASFVPANQLIAGFEVHPQVFHPDLELLADYKNHREAIYSADALMDLKKTYYSPNPLNDLLAAKDIFISNINESAELCEACGCTANCCNAFSGVMVYTKEPNDLKRVLFEYENERCLAGCYTCCPYYKRFTIVTKGTPDPITTPLITVHEDCCRLMTRVFARWFNINALISLDNSIRFERLFEYNDGKNQGAGMVLMNPAGFCFGEIIGRVFLNGELKYIIRNKQFHNTTCGTAPCKCSMMGGQCCCYDYQVGMIIKDIVDAAADIKVGEMILTPRAVGRTCGCGYFQTNRNCVQIRFPSSCSLPERYALMTFAINLAGPLAFKGKSY